MSFARSIRSPHRYVIAAIALAVAVAGPVAAQDDDSIGDIREKREEARDAEADALVELEVLELEDERIAEIVTLIQTAVDNQSAQVAAAQQQFDAAVAEVETREKAAADASDAIVLTELEIQQRAVDAFVGTNREFEPWLTSTDLNQTAIRLSLLDFAAGSDRDLLDDLRTAEAEREEHLRAGETARAESDELRVALEGELAELEERRKTQARIQAELRGRIDDWQVEAEQRAREAEEFTALIKEK